jgi:hypothetical protein
MTLREQMTADLTAAFYHPDEFAESATYNGASILVIEDGGYSRTTNVPGVMIPALSIRVMAADVPAPKPGDKVIMREATYYVSTPPTSDGGEWLLELDREVRRLGV